MNHLNCGDFAPCRSRFFKALSKMAGHVVRVGETGVVFKGFMRSPKETVHLKYLGMNVGIMFKTILNTYDDKPCTRVIWIRTDIIGRLLLT
jgi:hypothetical protein